FSLVALPRQLALDDAHVAEMNSVVGRDDGERKTVSRRGVVDQGVSSVARALGPDFGAAGDQARRLNGLRPVPAIVAGGGDPAHVGDTDEFFAVVPAEEGVRLAGDPFFVDAGDLALGPGGGIVPLDVAIAQQPAAVLLLELHRVGEKLAAGGDEGGAV